MLPKVEPSHDHFSQGFHPEIKSGATAAVHRGEFAEEIKLFSVAGGVLFPDTLFPLRSTPNEFPRRSLCENCKKKRGAESASESGTLSQPRTLPI